MREKLKAAYYLLLEGSGSDIRRLKKIRRENLTVVLNFHQVSPKGNPFWPPLHPQIFNGLLEFLKANFDVVLFDGLRASNGGKPRVILSFDDGYYDFVEYATPILDKHGVRANMNIIPACVESGEPIWNVQLYDFLRTAPKTLVGEITLPGFEIRLNDNSNYAKQRYGLGISRFLKNRPRNERLEMWQSVERIMERHEFERTRMMTRQDLLQIAKTHDIGVHSYSHESMEFEEVLFFEDDLQKCRTYFKEQLNLPLETYAFPNGSFRPEHVKILKRNGIRNILIVGEDYYRPDDPVFSRFTIYGSSVAEAKYHALGINKQI